MGIGTHSLPNRGEKDEWLTPPEILTALGSFDLDPCSPVKRPWDTAKKHFTTNENGLTQNWAGRVWLNPPYGSETGKWLERLVNHGNGIALIFARTETEMFRRWVWERADSLFFFYGRLYFHHVSGARGATNAGAPSVLIAYGNQNTEVLKQCKLTGKLIELQHGI